MNKSSIRSKILICALSLGVMAACAMDGQSADGLNPQQADSVEKSSQVTNGKFAPAKGLLQENLFNEKLNSTNERFDRLEDSVQALHDTLKSHLPAIETLTAIESDIQELVAQLQTLVSEPMPNAIMPIDIEQEDLTDTFSDTGVTNDVLTEISAPKEKNASTASLRQDKSSIEEVKYKAPPLVRDSTALAAAPKPLETVSTASVDTTTRDIKASESVYGAATLKNTINAVRISQSPEKTRVVLDSEKKINYGLEYDQNEGLIFITARNANVIAILEQVARKSNHIMSIMSTKEGADSNLIFVLQGAHSVSKGVLLSPNSDNNQYRYFFDVY